MRYSVRLTDDPRREMIIEAAEFHQLGAGVSFFAERMVNRNGNDQWGNPRRQAQRVAVAFFNNVSSIMEIPEEDPGIPEVAVEQGVPFNDTGVWDVQPRHEWVADELVTATGAIGRRPLGGRGIGATQPMADIPVAQAMDDDGVAWDNQRDE